MQTSSPTDVSTLLHGTLLWLSFALLHSAGLAAQDFEAMGSEFREEAQNLDIDFREHRDARSRERDAIAKLERLSRELDAAINDPSVPPSELMQLDNQITVARQVVVSESVNAAEVRSGMYQHMQGLERLMGRIENMGIELTEAHDTVGGTWGIETEDGLTGLFTLHQEGATLRGTYRFSNGRQGSLAGTLGGPGVIANQPQLARRDGQHLKLQMLDATGGPRVELNGLVTEAGHIDGAWTSQELGTGRAAAGRWSGELVTLESLLGFN